MAIAVVSVLLRQLELSNQGPVRPRSSGRVSGVRTSTRFSARFNAHHISRKIRNDCIAMQSKLWTNNWQHSITSCDSKLSNRVSILSFQTFQTSPTTFLLISYLHTFRKCLRILVEILNLREFFKKMLLSCPFAFHQDFRPEMVSHSLPRKYFGHLNIGPNGCLFILEILHLSSLI